MSSETILQEQVQSMEMMLDQTTSYMEEIQTELKDYKDQNESSMRYAKSLQKVLFQNGAFDELKDAVAVFHQQKTHVGGDLPFLYSDQEMRIIAMIDCTGHGIPGGFLTMIANVLLTQTIKENQFSNAGELLSKFNQNFHQNFGFKDMHYNHGMDMSVIVDHPAKGLTMASARRPIELVFRDKTETVKGDKNSIGENNTFTFTNHELDREMNKIIMYSDGLVDQFGKNQPNQKEKKFKNNQLRALLSKHKNRGVHSLVDIIKTAFMDWKENTEQTDDVLVMGYEIN